MKVLVKGCKNIVMSKNKIKIHKKLSLVGLLIVSLLCIAISMQAKHIGTLFNSRVVDDSFVDVASTQSLQRDNETVLPTDNWADKDNNNNVAANFDGGTGDFEDPYLISTPQQMALMAYKINHFIEEVAYRTASYKLTQDVDMSGHFWLPVGRWESSGLSNIKDRYFKGTFDGAGFTISNVIMKSHGSWSNGTTVGFFGTLGDGAVIANVMFDMVVVYLDPEIETSERVSMAIVVAQVERNATIMLKNVVVYNSVVFIPPAYDPEIDDGIEIVQNEVKSGIFVGWQQDQGSGRIYMDNVHARMTGIFVNVFVDLYGWDMSPDVNIYSLGGMIGEARLVDIQDSSFEGTIALEMVRKDRNMDNAQFVFNAGGAIGTFDVPNDKTSYLTNVELSGIISVDTFGKKEFSQSRSLRAYDETDIDWVADVRQIGSIIGDANIWGRGDIELTNIEASFVVDAPTGNRVQVGDQGEGTDRPPFGIRSMRQSLLDIDQHSSEFETQRAEMQRYAKENEKKIAQREFKPKANDKLSRESGLAGPPSNVPVSVPMSVGGAALILTLSYFIMLYPIWSSAFFALYFVSIGLAAVIIVLIIIAVVVLTILFSIWAYQRPKWESIVYVGAAVGSKARKNINFTNVRTASTAVPTDTMFSEKDNQANKVDSHNTLPTMAMIVSQPEAEPVEYIGQEVTLSVEGKGTVMSDGRDGADSFLTYQWYYNEIDSNNILEDKELGTNGAKTVVVEGATEPTLKVRVDWVGSRYYFARVTNNVLEFKGTNPTVTARVGSKNISAKPAEIVRQPLDTTINVSTPGTLSVEARATGDMSYQWYVNDKASVDGGTLLAGATRTEFSPVHNVAGDYYYYAIVSVSVQVMGSSESKRADTVSAIARVRVAAIANDFKIEGQPTKSNSVMQNTLALLAVEVDFSAVNGEVGYQWYRASNASEEGIAIAGERGQSIAVDTSKTGTWWYYVAVSNRVEGSEVTKKSERGQVVVTAAPVVVPDIVVQPEGGETSVGIERELQVMAIASGAKVSYQWYRNSTASNQGGTAIAGATYPSYRVHSEVSMVGYYYAQVKSRTVQGGVTSVNSKAVRVEVKDPNQQGLSISSDNEARQVSIGGKVDLRVESSRRAGSTNYQWYESEHADGREAKAIKGANGNVWRVKGVEQGTKYYFVEVLNVVDVKVQRERQVDTIKHINSGKTVPTKVVTNGANAVSGGVDVVLVVGIAALLMGIVAAVALSVVVVANKRKQGR